MSHILTLEVPDEVFADLENGAASMGLDVADYCLNRLKNGSINGAAVEDDPFWKAAGSIEGEVPADLATNHDFYLAEAIADKHAPTS